MKNMSLLLFLIVINSYMISEKKRHPHKWENSNSTFKIIWSALSIMLIAFMMLGAVYMFTKSNADREAKLFYLISISVFICFFAVQIFSLWKKKK